jgi:hypothetical protein
MEDRFFLPYKRKKDLYQNFLMGLMLATFGSLPICLAY